MSLKLLGSDQAVNVPLLQVRCPLTQDVILIRKLRSRSSGASHTTCASAMVGSGVLSLSEIRSDMEEFKGANPRAQLLDFVRWCCPAAWREAERSRHRHAGCRHLPRLGALVAADRGQDCGE